MSKLKLWLVGALALAGAIIKILWDNGQKWKAKAHHNKAVAKANYDNAVMMEEAHRAEAKQITEIMDIRGMHKLAAVGNRLLFGRVRKDGRTPKTGATNRGRGSNTDGGGNQR